MGCGTRLCPKARHGACRRVGIQGLLFFLSLLPVGCGELRRAGQGQGTLPSRKDISLSLLPSIPPSLSIPPSPLPQLPSLCLQDVLPGDTPTSPNLPMSAPQQPPHSLWLPRGPISLLTLALMGPMCLQNEMMAAPRAHSKCQRKSPRKWMAQIGGGGTAFQEAVDAFTPLSRGGWGGAAAGGLALARNQTGRQ